MTDNPNNQNTLYLTVQWRKPWLYFWNRYEVGEILKKSGAHSGVDIKKIHRKADGQIRIETRDSGWPLNSVSVSINASAPVSVKGKGRSGRLHIWYP